MANPIPICHICDDSSPGLIWIARIAYCWTHAQERLREIGFLKKKTDVDKIVDK